MKTLFHRLILAACLAGAASPAPGGLYYSWSGSQAIPDDNGSGRARSFGLSDPLVAIGQITVTPDIYGGYNGDLYGYLPHEDGFAALLNQVGCTGTSEDGYSPAGFLGTLTGSATADIHNYQSLSPAYNGSGQLTGTWGADGRFVNPSVAFETTPRTATLAGLHGSLAGPAGPSPDGLSYSWSGSQAIPDNNGSGLAYSFSLSGPLVAIGQIKVTLDISGGYNGDLYAYLSHGDGFAVLLNRVGRTGTSEDGYSTAGFLVTLTGSATADIHNYQSLSPTYNGSGQLTGTWGADGRDVDPSVAYDTTPRTATLAGFHGINPNGFWTIYFLDTSSGGISTLKGWSVDVTAVPEPVNVALGVFAAVALLARGGRAWWSGRFRRKA